MDPQKNPNEKQDAGSSRQMLKRQKRHLVSWIWKAGGFMIFSKYPHFWHLASNYWWGPYIIQIIYINQFILLGKNLGFFVPSTQSAQPIKPWWHISFAYIVVVWLEISYGQDENKTYTGWWFQTFFFTSSWGNDPNWLICFIWVGTYCSWVSVYSFLSLAARDLVELWCDDVIHPLRWWKPEQT